MVRKFHHIVAHDAREPLLHVSVQFLVTERVRLVGPAVDEIVDDVVDDHFSVVAVLLDVFVSKFLFHSHAIFVHHSFQ